MTQIQTISIKRNPSYLDFTYKMSFVLPAVYGNGATPIKGLSIILASYPDGFSSEIVSPDGTVLTFTETLGIPLTATLAQIKTQLIAKYSTIRNKLDSLTLTSYDTIAGLSYDGTNWT